jgi:hypothetical protein
VRAFFVTARHNFICVRGGAKKPETSGSLWASSFPE